jgi:hypothetical protein
MRKWKKVLLIVLAVVLALILALFGLAWAGFFNPIHTVRAAPTTAYVVAYDGGFWFEAGGDANAPTAMSHDAGTPVPANYDVVLATGWMGQDKNVSDHPIKIRIPEAGMELSYERAGAYWTGSAHYDEYWIKLLFPINGFQPPSGAKIYANHFWCPLTGEEEGLATNLAAAKKLPQGTYTVYYEETIPQPMTGLDCIYDGPKTPYQGKVGTNVVAPYTFTVGPPAG